MSYGTTYGVSIYHTAAPPPKRTRISANPHIKNLLAVFKRMAHELTLQAIPSHLGRFSTKMTTTGRALLQTYLYVYLIFLTHHASCLAMTPPTQSLSQILNLPNAGIHFECDKEYAVNMDIIAVLSAWRKIPRTKDPVTFAERGADVDLPKRFMAGTL
ncbi:MAG: hypothetical protein L6R40_004847 [Gallowayella cf. fulva]|nr:MAG: hypothetical protein L6R40_004847 [Xanthomendoza cf. fulva]